MIIFCYLKKQRSAEPNNLGIRTVLYRLIQPDLLYQQDRNYHHAIYQYSDIHPWNIITEIVLIGIHFRPAMFITPWLNTTGVATP